MSETGAGCDPDSQQSGGDVQSSPTDAQARIRQLAKQIATLERELVDITGGELDAVVADEAGPPFLLSAARRSLSESEQRFRAIFDNALDCMFLCDDNRLYLDANPAACRLLGRERDEIVGRYIGDFFEFVDVPDLQQEWQTRLAAHADNGEYRLRRPDGTELLVEYSLVQNVEPGRHLLVARDVTEQRRNIQIRDELNAQLERRNFGLLALHGIGVKLGESLDLHAVYETIFREFTYHFLTSPHLAVALFDKETEHFVCDFAVVDGEIYDPSSFPPMPLGEGPTSRAFLELESQIVDIQQLTSDLPEDRVVHIGDEAEPRSGIYVPLVVNNEAIGVLSVQHYEENAFQDIDLTLLSVMANHAAAAISNALLYRQTQQEIADRKRRERELAAIATLSRELRTAQGQISVMDTLLIQVQNHFGAQGAGVVLIEGDAQEIAVGHGAFAALTGQKLESEIDPEQAVVAEDTAAVRDSIWGNACPSLHALGSAPLWVQNVSLGGVVVGLDRAFAPEEMDLLAALADIAASTLQRERLYEEVQLQAQRLMRVMDTVSFGLLLLDAERRIVLANRPAMEELDRLAHARVGTELQALGGVALQKILSTPHSGGHGAGNGQVFGQEITLDSSDAQASGVTPVVYDVLANPVEIEGQIDGWVLVIRDITHDRDMQAQLQRQDRLAAVGQLAAGIAHDFNNILAVITLYVQMLQRSPNLQETELNRLSVVREQALHAGELVKQVLDFSRMSVIEKRHLDLIDLVHTAMDLWERILPENIRLGLQVHPEVFLQWEAWNGGNDLAAGSSRVIERSHAQAATDAVIPQNVYLVNGDPARLQQMLMNLALNARDAISGGGELRVDLARYLLRPGEEAPVKELIPGLWIHLQIADTGQGITPDNLPHIFDPFFTTKGVGKGTGLGLAQVYGIVRQHGGCVTVESRVGEGTRFHIFLPSAEVSPFDAAVKTEEADGTHGAGTILLVEDNLTAREATQAILEMYGYAVIEAENGVDALDYFRRHMEGVDLILTDFVMPEMGGQALYEAVSQLKPELPVLFMTGYPLDADGRRLMELGAVDWLQKPFTIQELTEKVQKLLETSASA